MSTWSKMITALRGGINEANDVINDSRAMRILDQEVRDATESLKQLKKTLSSVTTKKTLAEEHLIQLQKMLSEHEQYAVQALQKNDHYLALEIAEKVAEFEQQEKTEKQTSASSSLHIKQLKLEIFQAELNIKRLKQQIDMVKATECVQRAQATITERHNNISTKPRTALDSLEALKQKQAQHAAHLSAARERDNQIKQDDLTQKLEQAGIIEKTSEAQAVLNRIKEKLKS